MVVSNISEIRRKEFCHPESKQEKLLNRDELELVVNSDDESLTDSDGAGNKN